MTNASTTALPTRPADLDERDDAELLAMVQSLPRDDSMRDQACEVLVNRYRPLVKSCVLRYRNSVETPEELMQVGYVGLLKAINNFDPALGTSLAGYAQPCVRGEVRRHFRDRRWQVHVQRSLQELRLGLRNASSDLTNELGRMPTDAELAQRLDVTEEDVRQAKQADEAFQAASLDSPLTGLDSASSLGDMLGSEDPQLEHVIDMQAVWSHWNGLPDQEQQLLLMRFYGNMTQAEIGEQFGISQMQVSRLLARALTYLRRQLAEPVTLSA
ncbi:MAG TPA: SigB/SigF/SigG family RNA polymerase sigma factor [Streptosporangiaceae bacterium]